MPRLKLSPAEKNLALAEHILDALTKDRDVCGKIAVELEYLCKLDHWSVDQQNHYGRRLHELAELLSRYRTSESILTLPPERTSEPASSATLDKT